MPLKQFLKIFLNCLSRLRINWLNELSLWCAVGLVRSKIFYDFLYTANKHPTPFFFFFFFFFIFPFSFFSLSSPSDYSDSSFSSCASTSTILLDEVPRKKPRLEGPRTAASARKVVLSTHRFLKINICHP